MIRLVPIIHAMAGVTLAGACVVAWLVVPALSRGMSIRAAARNGFALALPASWAIAR